MDQAERYRQSLAWIHSIGRFGMKPGLERIAALLERLGSPHRRLRFLHIGGTNGKGSTAATAAAVLQAAGYRVGLYTSPYLLSFTNRMAVDGMDVDPAELVELVERVRPLAESISADQSLGQVTEFEVVTTLALLFFERRRPDLVVLEVGLGGRLDATNVVTPLLSVITNISLEHTDVLGHTIAEIAREKAGIIKPAVPLLTAAADPAALAVFQNRCRELNAPLYRVSSSSGVAGRGPLQAEEAVLTAFHERGKIIPDGQHFTYNGFYRRLDDLFIPLRGAYQVTNAATALAALELLAAHGFTINEPALRRGLAQTSWPGRLEVLDRAPLLIMDGAHNPAAAGELAAALPEYFSYRRLILILGIMADKDIEAILSPLLPLAHTLVLTRPELPRAADPHALADLIRQNFRFTGAIHIAPAVHRALALGRGLAGPADALLVTGSLYTVSEARAAFKDQ
ncbi:MAG: folylpolyglutamate synthase/dihydrofolate synthase family protein [Bacillota bacterium]